MESGIDSIIEKARIQELNIMEPTLKEYYEVNKIIIEYIKKKNLIIYGNYCIDLLIKNKNKDDGYYSKNKLEQPLINIYSTDPNNEIKQICNIIYEHKYKYIESTFEINSGLSKIYINLLPYIIISYIPENIYNLIPIININGIKCLHQHILYINSLYIYNTLLINSDILKEYFELTNLLIKYYDLDFKETKIIRYDLDNNIINFIIKNILPNNKFILCGYYAYYFYLSKCLSKIDKFIPYIDILSINYNKDVENINIKLLKHDPSITYKVFNPFLDYFGERTSFYKNDKVILNIYNQNDICIPYIKNDNNIICSYQYFIYSSLIKSFISKCDKNKKELNNFNYMVKNLIDKKNIYLDEHKKTILDDTIFKEFDVNCIGDTIKSSRKSRLYIMKKRKEYKPSLLRNNPENPIIYDKKVLILNKINGLIKS